MIVSREPKQIVERYMAAFFVVSKRMKNEIGDVLQEDMTMEQYQILDYISKRERCTSTELAEVFAVGKSSITAIITRLVDKDILLRTRDDEDRRVVYLSLTEQGKFCFHEAQARILDTIAAYLVHFKEEEVEGFISAFEKLAQLIGEGSRET